VRPSKATRPAAEVSAHGPRDVDQLGGKIDTNANKSPAEKQQRRRSLNSLLMPDEHLGHLGYRLSTKHACVFVIDGDVNYPRAQPLMPVWVSRWNGELESPAAIVWVGFAYSDAVRWVHAQAISTRSGFIDRLRRGERARA
jgi:hypothetical protein